MLRQVDDGVHAGVADVLGKAVEALDMHTFEADAADDFAVRADADGAWDWKLAYEAGEVALVQPDVSTAWVGMTVGALEERLDVRVAWLSRGSGAVVPRVGTVIQEHDRLHLAVSTDRIGQVRRALSHAPTQEA